MSFAGGVSFLYVKPNYQLKAIRTVRELSHLAKLHKTGKFHCLSVSNLLQNKMETFTPFTKSATTRKPARDSGIGVSLQIQWLGLGASAAGRTGLILGEGPKILQAVRLFQEEKINRHKAIEWKLFFEGVSKYHPSLWIGNQWMQGGRKDRNWREGSPCITFITDKGELEEQGFNLERTVWFIPDLGGVCVCVG